MSHSKEDDIWTKIPDFCGKSACDVNHTWSEIHNTGRVLQSKQNTTGNFAGYYAPGLNASDFRLSYVPWDLSSQQEKAKLVQLRIQQH